MCMNNVQMSSNLIKAIHSYVYLLIDPESNEIFYVGEGQGDRVLQHAKAAVSDNNPSNPTKIERIKSIQAKGLEVKYIILRHGILKQDKEWAFMLESSIIDLLKYMHDNHISAALTNDKAGHKRNLWGIKSLPELEKYYKERVVIEILKDEKILELKIKNLSNIDDLDFEVKREWNIDIQSIDKLFNCVIIDYNGRCVGVYKNMWDGKNFIGDRIESGDFFERFYGKIIPQPKRWLHEYRKLTKRNIVMKRKQSKKKK